MAQNATKVKRRKVNHDHKVVVLAELSEKENDESSERQEQLAENLQGVGNLRLDGSLRETKLVGNLLIGEAVETIHCENLAALVRQLRHGGSHLGLRLTLLDEVVGSVGRHVVGQENSLLLVATLYLLMFEDIETRVPD